MILALGDVALPCCLLGRLITLQRDASCLPAHGREEQSGHTSTRRVWSLGPIRHKKDVENAADAHTCLVPGPLIPKQLRNSIVLVWGILGGSGLQGFMVHQPGWGSVGCHFC